MGTCFNVFRGLGFMFFPKIIRSWKKSFPNVTKGITSSAKIIELDGDLVTLVTFCLAQVLHLHVSRFPFVLATALFLGFEELYGAWNQ
jgi:hypothetical protein